MNCPKCNHPTKVTDSRHFSGEEAEGTRRRRECQRCKYRFSTLETVHEFDSPLVGLQKWKAAGNKPAYTPRQTRAKKPEMSGYDKLRQKIAQIREEYQRNNGAAHD